MIPDGQAPAFPRVGQKKDDMASRLRVVTRRLTSVAQAESRYDLCQKHRSFAPWCFTTDFLLALNRRREYHAQKRGGDQVSLALDELGEVISSTISVEDALEAKELSVAVDAFLRTLPKTERRVFLRRYWYLDSIAALSYITQAASSLS